MPLNSNRLLYNDMRYLTPKAKEMVLSYIRFFEQNVWGSSPYTEWGARMNLGLCGFRTAHIRSYDAVDPGDLITLNNALGEYDVYVATSIIPDSDVIIYTGGAAPSPDDYYTYAFPYFKRTLNTGTEAEMKEIIPTFEDAGSGDWRVKYDFNEPLPMFIDDAYPIVDDIFSADSNIPPTNFSVAGFCLKFL